MERNIELKNKFNDLNKKIESKDVALCTKDFFEDTKKLIDVFSCIDGELRDEIGWATLSKYFQSNLFPSELRQELLDILTSEDYLFFELDRGQSNSSVKRSFSVLAISDLIWGDNENGRLLDEGFLNSLTIKVTNYLLTENDVRGFDEEIGWVHGIAHSGDTLSALIMHPKISLDSIKLILNSIIKYLIKRQSEIFKWDENFRLARPIGRAINILDKKDIETILINKLQPDFLYETPAKQNILNTLRCLYIELHKNKYTKKYVFDWIEQVTH